METREEGGQTGAAQSRWIRSGMQFRLQEDEKMGSVPSLLFSVCLLLSITLSSTALPALPASSTPKNSTEIGGSSTAPTAVPTSLGQSSTVTMEISTSSTQPSTTTTEASPSLSQSSTIDTSLSPSPTQENSTDLTTTPLPSTTDLNQTTGWNTTEHSPTNQTQPTPLHSSTSVATSQSAQTTVTTMSISTPTETINTTATVKTQEPQLGLSDSEASMTILFGVVLGLTVLIIAGYSIHRCKQKRSQYIHQPLYNSSETVDRFSPPDDTLVISGGLYDGPETSNSAAEDAGLHLDPPPFAPQATQFRLEFLSEDQQKPPDRGAPTFQSFQPFDARD
ncbi:mucin-5AC-like [Anguilla anguilla]|uniref:mucin-5AC-like n=1 Tax=Anguilla anguilla TaxID=7936 RepID=UPI0015B2BE2F|nr:mucin-5AC-like [Anguilla anguilla]